MNTVLCLGEALIDVVHDVGQVREHVGGSPLNVAGWLSSLGHPVALATWIADDPHGDMIRQWMADRVVLMAPGSEGAERTSVANATLDVHGSASYDFDITWDLPPVELDGVAHLHTGSIAAVLEPGADKVFDVLQRAHAAGVTISYDPNVRPALMVSPERVRERIEAIIALADVVRASDEDVAWLYPDEPADEVLRRWQDLGPSLVVMTRGARGAQYLHGGRTGSVPARQASVVDTVGAGDSFMAGLVAALLDDGLLGRDRGLLETAAEPLVQEAIDRGIASAAVTVSRAGAYVPLR